MMAKAGRTQAQKKDPMLHHFEQRQEAMVARLRALVERESPSHDQAAVDRLGDFLAAELEALGGRVTRHRNEAFGAHLQADFAGGGGKPVLLLGHFDTVYEMGTLERMPFVLKDGRAHGPGSFDMKSGIVLMLEAIAGLRELRGGLPRPVTVLLVTDEEVGSTSSRPITERLARQSAAVLVCEPAGAGGAVKTARKGVGGFHLKVTGVAAHAGLDFTRGQSAILELARQIERVSGFTDLKRGLTVSVGIIGGGTRTNVIAAEAFADVDVRIQRAADGQGIERKMRALKPFNRKCKLEVTGGINRPPMERTAGVAALYKKAQAVAAGLGLGKLKEIAVGGGSDGNFTAGLGIPTLDGLGGVGDGAHATHEHVVVAELPRRAALLAGLMEAV
jgi:glutamate carboxypeptidase